MTWCHNLCCGSNLWFGMTVFGPGSRKVHLQQQLLQMALMSVVYYHQFIMGFFPNGIIVGEKNVIHSEKQRLKEKRLFQF